MKSITEERTVVKDGAAAEYCPLLIVRIVGVRIYVGSETFRGRRGLDIILVSDSLVGTRRGDDRRRKRRAQQSATAERQAKWGGSTHL